jgi:hypothetical protein
MIIFLWLFSYLFCFSYYKLFLLQIFWCSGFKFDEGIVEHIVKHEMSHALGLGHADFDGNLIAEKVNDGPENISKCEIKAVL